MSNDCRFFLCLVLKRSNFKIVDFSLIDVFENKSDAFSQAEQMRNKIVRDKKDIKAYCYANGIQIEDFKQPVSISDDVQICWYMFKGCKSFNQPVALRI